MADGDKGLLRARGGHEDSKVTFVELFFDLVFVFAVTQLSHSLLQHLTVAGADRDHPAADGGVVGVDLHLLGHQLARSRTQPPVRLMLFALMLAGLVLSTSIPEAFERKGLAFAGAYVFMQVGRSLFMLWALEAAQPRQLSATSSASPLLARRSPASSGSPAAWPKATRVSGCGSWRSSSSMSSPAVGFWTPRLGRSTTADWDVEGGHMAERCGLFIIIALGESILVTGATFAELPWTAATVAAFLSAFVGSVAMWWIYFNIGAETGQPAHRRGRAIPGRLARLAYTYLHLPLVAGIIVAAVGDELVLAHPDRPSRRQDRRCPARRPRALSRSATSCSSARSPIARRCRIWLAWRCWPRLSPSSRSSSR